MGRIEDHSHESKCQKQKHTGVIVLHLRIPQAQTKANAKASKRGWQLVVEDLLHLHHRVNRSNHDNREETNLCLPELSVDFSISVFVDYRPDIALDLFPIDHNVAIES
eukprot:TRINITY_DN10884_c0_g2_i3.p1 TRINITY_DN10884_c0_g2~~TRINITY_DN10884_c0_g2_i3.p1  ORF type:complete len:108 (-),score=9.60 TRINITY_DN10884_c0_g2_i3:505-828(-)